MNAWPSLSKGGGHQVEMPRGPLREISNSTSHRAIRGQKRIMARYIFCILPLVKKHLSRWKQVAQQCQSIELRRQELEREIASAIMKLPENYRIVITLRYHLDLDNQEIAEVLGISRENVEVRIHRARKALRKIILQEKEERGIKIGLSANR
jgi:RNA polymerase sigma factor (sigma-70 family)